MRKNKISVGIIGFGTVGTGVVRILLERHKELEGRLGLPLVLSKVADIDIKREREVKLPEGILTDDVRAVLDDPEIDIVVELIGGIHPTKELILEAIKKGKHVVTANKALLATEGEDIFRAVRDGGVELGFEGAVAGGIPIIKIVREALIGNKIQALYGIINGTSNYILTKMTKEKVEFSQALREAQALGYAEADPTLDVEGIDSAHKLAILASLSFGIPLSFKKIYTEGITRITPLDIDFALEFGYKIKLLAIAKATPLDKGVEVELRVHPTMLPEEYLLSNVDGVFNAIYVEGDAIGSALYYGKGAGQMPTGSAVVSDIVDIARDIKAGYIGRMHDIVIPEGSHIKIKNMEDVLSHYYFRFWAIDKPGVLSKISGILGAYNISIKSVIQKGRKKEKAVPLVLMTHEAREKDVVCALKEIDRLPVVSGRTTFIRVEAKEE